MSDVDYNEDHEETEEAAAPKKGGYDARVEQWLHENPGQVVLITSAGKDGVNYIQYTISCGGLEVKRRYSEFASLRATLVSLHPTLIIPPIPEKHTMADYAAKPTKAKEDAGIIELRKRMLAVFLNRCRKMKDVLEDGVFWRFLDPYTSWVCPSDLLRLKYGTNDSCERMMYSVALQYPTSRNRFSKHPRSTPQTRPLRITTFQSHRHPQN